MNLSKSGMGVSTGIPGLRLGAGPRGTYVRMGRGGIYYYQTLAPAHRQSTRTSVIRHTANVPDLATSDIIMEPVTGAATSELCVTHSSELVNQLNEASRKISAMPLVVLLCLPIVTIPLAIWLYAKDKARRTVVAFYEVNDAAASRFQSVVDSFVHMMNCATQWRVVAQGAVQTPYQQKTNAGASSLLRRIRGVADLEGPSVLATNIAVPRLHTPARSVYFLPDRILVRDQRQYADISYVDCKVTATPTRFIEAGAVPRDGKQVGTTWQYVNKGGSPDRRFKNNRQLPVMEYGELELATASGFRFTWQTSTVEAAKDLAAAISAMGAERGHYEPALPAPETSPSISPSHNYAVTPAAIGASAHERLSLLVQNPNTDLRIAAPLLGWIEGPVMVPAPMMRVLGLIDQHDRASHDAMYTVDLPPSRTGAERASGVRRKNAGMARRQLLWPAGITLCLIATVGFGAFNVRQSSILAAKHATGTAQIQSVTVVVGAHRTATTEAIARPHLTAAARAAARAQAQQTRAALVLSMSGSWGDGESSHTISGSGVTDGDADFTKSFTVTWPWRVDWTLSCTTTCDADWLEVEVLNVAGQPMPSFDSQVVYHPPLDDGYYSGSKTLHVSGTYKLRVDGRGDYDVTVAEGAAG